MATLKEVQTQIKLTKDELKDISNLRKEVENVAQVLSTPPSPRKDDDLVDQLKKELKSVLMENSSQRGSFGVFSHSEFTSRKSYEDLTGAKTPIFTGRLDIDYSNLAEFIFRTNSIIVNFVADLIKESPHFETLKKELKNYMRRNLDQAKKYFELKEKSLSGEEDCLKEFYDSGVTELKDIGK